MLTLFLQLIIPVFKNSQVLSKIIMDTEGKGLLLIVDSFDEFTQQIEFNSTLLCQVLKRQILPNATILITSRPGAWNQLLRGYA